MVKATVDSKSKVPLPEGIRAEAAVWLARLHSDVRTESTESGFRRWLAADAAHREAFERLTNTWEVTSNLRRRPGVAPGSEWRFFRRGLAAAAAALTVCALITLGAFSLLRSGGTTRAETFSTALGERRSLLLADGSHLVLNTDSRVKVSFGSRMRLVTIQKGQARFQVARNPARLFVVRAGGKQIIAVGTAFDVRWTGEQLSVVLVEGHVAVLPADERPSITAASAVALEPGERLEFKRPELAVRSSVRLEREEAWVNGRVVFDSTPLDAAIAEMNRYAVRKLVLGSPGLAKLRISGTFSVDDSSAFARAVAQMLSLKMTTSSDSILLSRAAE
jgi:transmembrane sensor